MAQAFTKPYLSVADQITLLKTRGMIISDDTRAGAYLERIGYYRLSGYWYSWRDSTHSPGKKATIHDHFRVGTMFESVIQLYVFDKKLRLLMLDGIERLEIALRTEIALILGQRSHIAHRHPHELHHNFARRILPKKTKTAHQEWLERLDRANHRSQEDFAKHYATKYSSPLPVWVAIELWDFGMLSHFLSGMRESDLDTIAQKYGLPRRDLLTSWVRSINFVRNICAHHCRLWNRSMVDQPKIPPLGAIPCLDHVVTDTYAQERLYGVASAMRYLLRKVNPTTTWGERLGLLLDTFPLGSGVSTRHMGFPSGWQAETLWP